MNTMANKHRYQHSSADHTERSSNENQPNFFNQYPPSNSNQYSTTIPHERESWIRAVRKTTINESAEQRTQYLEKILRLPQPQPTSSMDSSMFDRIRFANDQTSTSINTIENPSIDHGQKEILFGNQLQTTTEVRSDQKVLATSSTSSTSCMSVCPANTTTQSYSAFLINDCDDEEELPTCPPPLHPSSLCPVLSIVGRSIVKNRKDLDGQCEVLVNELDTAEVERKRVLTRRRRLRRQSKKKMKKTDKQKLISSVNNNNSNNHQGLSSTAKYDASGVNRISEETGMIQKASTTSNEENQVTKVNRILTKMRKQQRELRKLRQYVISLLNEQKHTSTDAQQNLHVNQQLLLTHLNQPIVYGCWLCSGKKYSEIATQCDYVDEQE